MKLHWSAPLFALILLLSSCHRQPEPDWEGVWYLENSLSFTPIYFNEETEVPRPEDLPVRAKPPQDTTCRLYHEFNTLEVRDGKAVWNRGSLGRPGWPVEINTRKKYLEVEKHGNCRFRFSYAFRNDSLLLYKEDEDEELKLYYGDEEIIHFGGKKVEEEDRDWVREYFTEMEFPLKYPIVAGQGDRLTVDHAEDVILLAGKTHDFPFYWSCRSHHLIRLKGANRFISLREMGFLKQRFLEERDNRVFIYALTKLRQTWLEEVTEIFEGEGLAERSFLCVIDTTRQGFDQIRWVNIKQLEETGVMPQFDPWRWQNTQ
jgi:hypothetical protein